MKGIVVQKNRAIDENFWKISRKNENWAMKR